MNTFLPSISLEQSAKWLDNTRLGKQRVECYQILKALTDPTYGWQNHPAVTMWQQYKHALLFYSVNICLEWQQRGYKDTCKLKIIKLANDNNIYIRDGWIRPPWLTESFASNHRSILLGKAVESLIQAKYNYGQATWDKSEEQKKIAIRS